MGLDITGRYRYPLPREQWLAQAQESVIDAALPIVDAHHHIWQEGGYPYLLEQLVADLRSGHNIRATVAVQAHYGYLNAGPEALRCVGETVVLNAVAEAARERIVGTAVCAAIVAFADLTLGDAVEPVLEAHRAAAPTRLAAVRHSVVRDSHFPDGIVVRPAPPHLLADAAYRAGLKTLARCGLGYEAMLYHQQIGELTDAARAVPGLSIVLDHFGCILGVGPYRGREQDTYLAWRKSIVELASCPNVSIKLGGLGMIVCGPTWHERTVPPSSVELAQAWRPYVEICIEYFGPQRCMFESNFPVDKAMYSYRTVWNAFKRLASGASLDEKVNLFHDTAARCYRIAA